MRGACCGVARDVRFEQTDLVGRTEQATVHTADHSRLERLLESLLNCNCVVPEKTLNNVLCELVGKLFQSFARYLCHGLAVTFADDLFANLFESIVQLGTSKTSSFQSTAKAFAVRFELANISGSNGCYVGTFSEYLSKTALNKSGSEPAIQSARGRGVVNLFVRVLGRTVRVCFLAHTQGGIGPSVLRAAGKASPDLGGRCGSCNKLPFEIAADRAQHSGRALLRSADCELGQVFSNETSGLF